MDGTKEGARKKKRKYFILNNNIVFIVEMWCATETRTEEKRGEKEQRWIAMKKITDFLNDEPIKKMHTEQERKKKEKTNIHKKVNEWRFLPFTEWVPSFFVMIATNSF